LRCALPPLPPGTTLLLPNRPRARCGKCIYGVKIKDGAMCPTEISVEEGDQVTLWWTSHIAVEVHLHGYDLKEEVSPGEETDLSFEANLTGRFEI
jgi:FtsP/CotA-like multicopper oxidase with cupredoxin domain